MRCGSSWTCRWPPLQKTRARCRRPPAALRTLHSTRDVRGMPHPCRRGALRSGVLRAQRRPRATVRSRGIEHTERGPSIEAAKTREEWVASMYPTLEVSCSTPSVSIVLRRWRQVHPAHVPEEMSVRQDTDVGLVELSRPMNHVFVREPGVVGDNPGHSKSRGGTAHCQVATDPVRQSKELRRILGALTSTGCHIERIGRLDEKVHARVVRPSHYPVPNSLRWRAGRAHQLAIEPIGTLDPVTVSGDAGAPNEQLRGYTGVVDPFAGDPAGGDGPAHSYSSSISSRWITFDGVSGCSFSISWSHSSAAR